VNGTSVVGVKFNGGVVIAADTLGSYGSLARFKNLKRIRTVGETTLIGAGGEYSDFQSLMDMLEDHVTEEYEEGDGSTMFPREIFSLINTVMYNRRNKMDPYYNQLVIGGFRPGGKAFLGYSDLHGSNYEDDHVATGYGAHIARPLLRKHWKPDMTQEQAIQLVELCMEVLFYRDKNTINHIQFAVANAEGVQVQEPRELPTRWEHLEKPENAAVQKTDYISEPLKK